MPRCTSAAGLTQCAPRRSQVSSSDSREVRSWAPALDSTAAMRIAIHTTRCNSSWLAPLAACTAMPWEMVTSAASPPTSAPYTIRHPDGWCGSVSKSATPRSRCWVQLSTPTLMIQGESDSCGPPKESEGLDDFFTRGHRRILIDGVGHFPTLKRQTRQPPR
jgi:pimeloyl-ACP methyl ester carboxylesterase